ncbi:MAG: hypothetical protein ACI8ZN_001590 [Bacteroidia bacterium]|jgi:hypothetical protein
MRKIWMIMLIGAGVLQAQAQSTHSLVAEVNLDSLIKTVREFSGEDSTMLNDTMVLIQHRVSNKGNDLAADYLADRLQALGLQVEVLNYRKTGRNIVGTITGKTNPDSIYIICAHYDAVADYCADDNASGSATVLEAARIMNKYCFNNTIKFIFFDEEELGLIGSKYYADTAFVHGDKIVGVLNMDMLGYDGDSNRVFDIHTNNLLENQRLKDTVLYVLDTLNIDLVPNVINPGTTRSDHASFWKRGYAAVFCGESFIGGDPNPNYHTAKDRIALFDLSYFHKLAQLAIGTVVELVGVIPTVQKNDTVQACHEYTYKDTTFYASTVYRDRLKTSMDCDSIYVLHLSILPIYDVHDTLDACYAYVYKDTTFYTSTTYVDSLKSSNGCDSIFTLHVDILPRYEMIDTVGACGSYAYKDTVFYSSTTHRDSIKTVKGCDSIHVLHINIWEISSIVDSVRACGSYSLGTKIFTQSSVYEEFLTTKHGCDSSYQLVLEINPIPRVYKSIQSCDDYLHGSKLLTSSGWYTDTSRTAFGCDSFNTLDLNITRINDSVQQNKNVLKAAESQASYQWMQCSGGNYQGISGANGREYTVTSNGWYAVKLTKNNCVDTSSCVFVTHVGINSLADKGLLLYPNPTDGIVHIEPYEAIGPITTYIYNMQGVLIKTEYFAAGQNIELTMPSPSAMYLLKIESETGVTTHRVLRKH